MVGPAVLSGDPGNGVQHPGGPVLGLKLQHLGIEHILEAGAARMRVVGALIEIIGEIGVSGDKFTLYDDARCREALYHEIDHCIHGVLRVLQGFAGEDQGLKPLHNTAGKAVYAEESSPHDFQQFLHNKLPGFVSAGKPVALQFLPELVGYDLEQVAEAL